MEAEQTNIDSPESVELSISIVTYEVEQAAFTSVLASLNSAIEYMSRQAEVLVKVQVIDNGKQAELLKSVIRLVQRPLIQYEMISNKSNLGFGRAHNLSIVNSKARFHLILNPDVILANDSLCEGINYLRENNEVCAVTPRAIESDGSVQYLCKNYPALLQLLLRGFAPKLIRDIFTKYLDNYEMRNQTRDETVKNIPLISGCFMLCDRKHLQATGGFSKKYFLYFEDFALSKELNKHGSLVYLPTMKIQHFGGNSAGKGIKHIYMFIRSAITFFNHYGWKIF